MKLEKKSLASKLDKAAQLAQENILEQLAFKKY
jgi:hypothetical protein